jgi:hypothetical protein
VTRAVAKLVAVLAVCTGALVFAAVKIGVWYESKPSQSKR